MCECVAASGGGDYGENRRRVDAVIGAVKREEEGGGERAGERVYVGEGLSWF